MDRPPLSHRALAWGRLLRVSLAPSAAADVAAGAVLAAGLWPGWSALYAILGSLCVYTGGMVLNDWADQVHDGATRPDRPIPSGAVSSGAALTVGWLLLALGPVIALAAGPRAAALLGVAALSAAIYDLWGRGPRSGPSLLALCRAANLGAGIATGLGSVQSPPTLVLVAAPLCYGGYVFVVSRLGRLEDGEDERPLERRPALYLAQAAALLVLAGTLGFASDARLGPWPPLALAAVGALGLVQLALRTDEWSAARVGAAMGQCLRRLLVFTAVIALAARTEHGLWVAAAILTGYPVSYALRGWFPPS